LIPHAVLSLIPRGIPIQLDTFMTTTKAISVRQPWANAIMLGKNVENRSRYFSHRGPLVIHASLRVDKEALSDRKILALPPRELLFGHLIGVVTVLDCVRISDSPWADASQWKLLLAYPRPLLHPVPCRGQLGLFNVDRELLRGSGLFAV
jgi:hypothetical protein